MIPLPTIPDGWSIVLADPPWRFAGNSEAKPGRNPMRHYDCMRLDEIAALPVAEIVARDALLLMWTTAPFAHLADSVVKSWGFKTKSQLVWIKDRPGTGYWARNQHEILIIARRGRFPCALPALFPTSIIPGKQREHSRKPSWPQDIVDARYPDARRLELFARRPRLGWTVWGNQTEKFDHDGPDGSIAEIAGIGNGP